MKEDEPIIIPAPWPKCGCGHLAGKHAPYRLRYLSVCNVEGCACLDLHEPEGAELTRRGELS